MAATTQRGWSEGLRAQDETGEVHRPDTEPGNGGTLSCCLEATVKPGITPA